MACETYLATGMHSRTAG